MDFLSPRDRFRITSGQGFQVGPIAVQFLLFLRPGMTTFL